MNDGYVKIGEISQDTRDRALAICRNLVDGWQVSKGETTDYAANMEAHEAIKELSELTDRWPVEQWQSAFFLVITPGGKVHRHTDSPHPWNTYHIVLLTNPECRNSMYYDDGSEHHFNLQAGAIYRVDRSIEHGSHNNGDEDRIHLLVEVHD